MYKTSCIGDIRRDFENTQAVSEEITMEACKADPFPKRLLRSILKIFAPLM